MVLSYFDESGDTGFPRRSSDLFVLASVSMLATEWKYNLEQIQLFRRQLQQEFGFPIKQEFHTKEFVQDKDPYHGKYSPEARRKILFRYVKALAKLRVRATVVVIDKTAIKNTEYDVLEKALTYNIQRIENSLKNVARRREQRPEPFLIITDEGQTGGMTRVGRKIQKINYVPSMYGSASVRREIELLVEDPLPKNSAQSYFIQAADTVAFISMLYATRHLCANLDWANRVKRVLEESDAVSLMDAVLPIMNTKASSVNRYGIVCQPR